MHQKGLYVARKAPGFLPEGYKERTNTVVTGKAKTGEVSVKGLVAHTETWDGRIAATVGQNTIRYVRNPDGTIRPMTFRESVERGHFILGRGPTGIRLNYKTSHESTRPN